MSKHPPEALHCDGTENMEGCSHQQRPHICSLKRESTPPHHQLYTRKAEGRAQKKEHGENEEPMEGPRTDLKTDVGNSRKDGKVGKQSVVSKVSINMSIL